MRKSFHVILLVLLVTSTLFAQQNRPQEPKGPFSYHAEEVVFENETDSISLAGTLTFPKEGSNFPVVILISGSGAQNRNSEILGHKSFLVIADYLSTNGIAVLRVDDRGIGGSTGIYNETGLDGFVYDTKFAIDYLKSRKEVNQNQIGLIGHSLGGLIAPVIASESDDINFIILLAGPGMRGDQLMLLQKELIERNMGMSEETIVKGQKEIGGAYEIMLKSTAKSQILKADLKKYFTRVYGEALPGSQVTMLAEQLAIPWIVDFVKHDPAVYLSKVKCPVLALNGVNDLQVPVTENITAIEKLLKANGNNKVTTMALPKLNHLFQESETGLPSEYATLEETFSPKVLKIMGDWILAQIE